MDVPEQHAQQLAELAAAVPCDIGHKCLKSDLWEPCRTKHAAEGEVLFCLEERARWCRYHMFFGNGVICLRPIRQYIAKHLYI